jgi:aldehyde:ferredoxin oxidoreductase
MGKMLFVDLAKKEIKEEVLDEKLCRQFIGGYGLGARILFSRQKAGADPLGPDNILGFVTGPMTGTSALGGSRYVVVGKSPLTGTWGDANSGGYFGPNLKFAGYDAVFFTGISEKPVYLFIDNGQAEIRGAAHLWGKDTFETEDILRSELGKDVEVACIGPSGENLSLIAAVMNNKGRAAARSGLGAVMGAKKLKAVAVRGNMKIPIDDDKGVSDLRRKYVGEIGMPASPLLKDFGTPDFFNGNAENGDAPCKNWGGTSVIDFPDYKLIGVEPVLARQEKKYACYRCPIGCGGHMKAGTEYSYEAGAHKPEYETITMFGSVCLNSNVESIIKLNDICNRCGIDTISAGAIMAFAIECYENGIITKADTDGIEMTWGNHKSIVAMTEKMARREGFGNILADGVKVAAEKIGKGADRYAIHIQGQEFPAHDPKFEYAFITAYRLDATPGRHTQHSEEKCPPGLVAAFDSKSFSGRGEVHKRGNTFGHVMGSAGMCLFIFDSLPNVNVVVEFLRAITGWDITFDELLEAGERIANIRQAFNIREGVNAMQFKMPDRVLGRPPQKEGPLAGITIDEDTMDRDYLATMDWDPRTMMPSKKKLQQLGLVDVAKALWP